MNTVKEYNKTLYDMMKRDSSFNIKMQRLGYKLRPVVGIIDTKNHTYTDSRGNIEALAKYPSFARFVDPSNPLYNRYKDIKNVEKIGVTEELEVTAKKLDEPTKTKNQQRNPLLQVFEYEMVLMAKLEKELGGSISKDKLLHIVEEHGLVPGYNDTVAKIEHKVEKPAQEHEPLTLTRNKNRMGY